MTLPSTDAALLKNDHRRRRWMIRICLLSLLILPCLILVGFLLSSPAGMNVNQAAAIFAQFKKQDTREDAERLLGKPVYVHPHTNADGSREVLLTWQFFTFDNGINVFFEGILHCNENGIIQKVGTKTTEVTGWSALETRWIMFLRRLGFMI